MLTREQKLDMIWKATHLDFRGELEGERSILVFEPGVGTTLVKLSSLTDEQIAERLPYALKKADERANRRAEG